jgi:secreted PhoX family phosphatase
MSRDADDTGTNLSTNAHFNDIVAERLRDPSRRDVLRGGFGLGALGWIASSGAGSLLAGCGDDGTPNMGPDAGMPDASPDAAVPPESPLGFTPVAKSLADTVVVPAGYSFTVLYSLGDPIAATVTAYANNGTDAPASFAQRAGDHHDGMHYFGFDGNGYNTGSSDRGLLVMNHEAISPLFLHLTGPTTNGEMNPVLVVRTEPGEVEREFFLHGVSIIEVRRSQAGAWSYVLDSPFNRRIHTLTPMEISGPLRGKAAMVTKFSTDGTRTRGTVNNCANGHTPWGTYLTCEENWAGYFRRIATEGNPRSPKEVKSFERYGVGGAAAGGPGREFWATVTPDTPDNIYGRWNIVSVVGASAAEDYRNAANTYGWVVEIDPFTNTSVPKKRTALGRIAHEGAWPAAAVAGKPLVYYMGDDNRGDYIYKYVSNANWDPADATRTDRLAVGDKYLDDGKLYVARFNADGTGIWLELKFGINNITAAYPDYAFADQDEVLVNTRIAADAAAATKMDRPEWAAVDPATGAVYFTLTNNNAATRPVAATDAANPRFYNDPKVSGTTTTNQLGNPNGHIIRWKEPSPEATTFTWDVYLFGAAADANPDTVNLSKLTADNDFSSPDGLWFSPKTNICWIQTDDGAYTDVTNCMLLAGVAGTVGDGATTTITNADLAGNTKRTTTYVGKSPGDNLRRFLVGPRDCEITGIAETPDGTALFVNIQHPGETSRTLAAADILSTWPSTIAGTRPRSSTIVITRDGGGVIGLKTT